MKLKIAVNIRKLRHNLNLSQEQLAERLGVRFQAVSKWERGETYPDIELLPSIDVLFESDDDLASMKQKADIYIEMAKLNVQSNEYDKAMDCLQKAIKRAEEHDKYPYGTQSTSILRSCKKYNYEVVNSSPTVHPYQKLKETLLESIKSDNVFAVLTSIPAFHELLIGNV